MTKVSNYVGTYHKYNCGSIFGRWFDLSEFRNLKEFLKAVRELHKDEDDPEFMFQDYECPKFMVDMGLISESHISDNIYEVLELVEQSEYSEEIFEAYFNCHGSYPSIEDTIEQIENTYCGEFESDEDFARWLLEDTEPVLKNIPWYISVDWESTARMVLTDYLYDGGHYFRFV